ncbi:hypothetical protein Lnau_2398 [Legionella nautarum]|uniref:Uncharacterized protein n=1 Tax=Legionella nautarum TaxID=45070 RepID=Q49J64_9GAMM|nr:hypothetical protein [Legionella nautarum]AAX56212.1 unknown [Legionella nautarum]KTD32750.1 hypothetical protein Lnau_2398 [Legionella nautarum]
MAINPYAHFSKLQKEQKESSTQESSEKIPTTEGAEAARGVRTLYTQTEKMDAIRPNEMNSLAKRILKDCYNTIHSYTSGNKIKETQGAKVEAGQEETTPSSPSFR